MATGPDLSLKRSFLIAVSDPRIFTTLNEKIGQQIKNSTFLQAVDGFEVLRKIENAPPQVLIVNKDLAKLPGFRVVEKVLSNSKLENTAIIILSSDFKLKFLAPGEVLIREGEPGESVFIVKSGELEASVTHNNERTKVGTITEGEFVGEMAYINHEPRSADVFAVTPCELIEIPMGLLDQVLFQKPAWSKALMITLSRRVRLGNARLSG